MGFLKVGPFHLFNANRVGLILRIQTFLPPGDRYAALLLYGMVLSTCFNGYDAGIMTVILADSQFIEYYGIDDNRSGIVASIPWAATGT